MIKARPCAGDIAAGEAFLKEVAPFIWRKYLDYGAVADVHAMKRQMHAYKGHDEIAIEGHNIKLGRGGIREIEFFVQTQQLIAGGRHPGAARPRDAGDARRPRRGRLDRPRGGARSRRGLSLPARRRAPAADGRRRADPHAAGGARRRWSASRASSALRAATPSRRRCSSTCARCSANTRGCSRTRPRPRPRAARSPFRPTRTTPRRSTSSPRWASAARSRSARRCAAGSRANIAR